MSNLSILNLLGWNNLPTETAKGLRNSVPNSTEIIEGKLFNYNPSEEEIKKWIEEIL